MPKSQIRSYEIDGERLFIEIDDSHFDDLIPASSPGEKINIAIEKMLKPLKKFSMRIIDEVGTLESEKHCLEKIEFDFGIKIASEKNIIISKASGEGNINLKLSWIPKK